MPRDLPSLDRECFFVAPIGSEGSPERARSDGVLDFIVARAAEELGLTAVRADQLAEPGQITLQVIDHILGARAAVADLTGLNPNVFYELAVRHTARLPVALIADKACKLPFDIAQMRTIFFDHTDLRSADQCRRDIVAQLREALEGGAVDSPVATSVDVRAMQAGTTVERNIAELVTTVEEMSRFQRMTLSQIEDLYGALRRVADHDIPLGVVEEMLQHLLVLERRLHHTDVHDPEILGTLVRLEESLQMLRRRSHRRRPIPPRNSVIKDHPSPHRSAEPSEPAGGVDGDSKNSVV